MSDHHHRAAAEPAEPADDCLVLGEVAVACERREVLDQAADEVEAVRAILMARHLGLLPGGELGIGLFQGVARLRLELGEFFVN